MRNVTSMFYADCICPYLLICVTVSGDIWKFLTYDVKGYLYYYIFVGLFNDFISELPFPYNCFKL